MIICNNNSRYCDLIRTLVHREYCMHNGSICSLKTSIQYVEDNFIPYLCDCVPSSSVGEVEVNTLNLDV